MIWRRRRRGAVREDEEHRVLVFAVVAGLLLGSLLLLGRLVSGAEEPSPTDLTALSSRAGTPQETSGGGTSLSAGPRIVSSFVAPVGLTPPPEVSGSAFTIEERSCGAVLFAENEHARLPPASITKIVTALVVRQHAGPNEMVDIDVSGSAMAKKGSSVMGLEPGMKMSVQDLLYGLFLPSGNDAAVALAEYVGHGNVGAFVQMMNDEAKRLGMVDTHFGNPHGLDQPGHYSSAADMAIAGRALLDDPYLSQISDTPEYQPRWNRGVLKNGNKLLQLYPGAFGVKIGFTDNAKQTMVAAAERDGRQIVVSLLGSSDRYTDSIALLDWAFANVPSRCGMP